MINYKEYEEAKWQFVLEYLIILICAFLPYTFSAISNRVQENFFLSEFQIYLVTQSGIFMALPSIFFSSYCIQIYGIRISIIVGLGLQTLGCFLRLFLEKSSFLFILGQFLLGLGSPFCGNTMGPFVLAWFLPKRRIFFISFLAQAYIVGISLCFWFTGFIIEGRPNDKETINALSLKVFLIAFVFYIIILIFFKNKPETPPTPLDSIPRIEYFKAFRSLYENKDYIKLFFAFGLVMGTHMIFVSSIYNIMSPFGYQNEQIGQTGSIINISSLIGKVTLGLMANSLLSFKNFLKIIYFFSFLSLFLLIRHFSDFDSEEKTTFTWLYIISFIFGFFYNTQFAAGLEFSSELAFPVSESKANSILALSGIGFATVMGFIFQVLEIKGKSILYILIFIYLISIALVHFIGDKLHRSEREKDHQEQMLIQNEMNIIEQKII